MLMAVFDDADWPGLSDQPAGLSERRPPREQWGPAITELGTVLSREAQDEVLRARGKTWATTLQAFARRTHREGAAAAASTHGSPWRRS
jgi:hypothetical protein